MLCRFGHNRRRRRAADADSGVAQPMTSLAEHGPGRLRHVLPSRYGARALEVGYAAMQLCT